MVFENAEKHPEKTVLSILIAIIGIIIVLKLYTENSTELLIALFVLFIGISYAVICILDKYSKMYITKIVLLEAEKYFDKENLEIIVKTKREKTKESK